MVQRTVNNVIVVRLQYNHCIVSVIWSELSSDNIMVSTVSTAASISSTPITSLEYLRSSHCRNMENVLFTQASHSSMQNLRCMYKIIYACMIMIKYRNSHQDTKVADVHFHAVLVSLDGVSKSCAKSRHDFLENPSWGFRPNTLVFMLT